MKLFKIGLLFVSILLFASCGNYVEEYSLLSDGSGTYKIHSEIISGSVEMSTSMVMDFADEEMSKSQKDSVRLFVTEKVWEQYPSQIDSTIDLVGALPDSFLAVKGNRKYAKRMMVYMRGSKEKGYINMGADFSYRNSADFIEFSKFFNNLQEAEPSGSSFPIVSNFSETMAKTDYVLDEKKFGRTVTFYELDIDDIEPTTGLMIEKLAKLGTFTTIVNTSKKIKLVTGENVVSQEDFKVVFEYPLNDYLEGNAKPDFEIVFE